MAAQGLTDQQYEAVRKRRVQEFLAKRGDVEVVGEDVIEALAGDRAFVWDGLTYRVPKVAYRDGLALARLARRLEALEKVEDADTEEVAAVYEEAIALFGRIVQHTGWRRLAARWLRNPFVDATEQDVGYLLAFFSACRMSRANQHARMTAQRASA